MSPWVLLSLWLGGGQEDGEDDSEDGDDGDGGWACITLAVERTETALSHGPAAHRPRV